VSKAFSYLIDSKESLEGNQAGRWDYFLSAYNESERVRKVFEDIAVPQKIWWIVPEYRFQRAEVAHLGNAVFLTQTHEARLIEAGLRGIALTSGARLCIDITGGVWPS
jgi:hypothetical protein